jgi:Tfp pilus assembly protein PilF
MTKTQPVTRVEYCPRHALALLNRGIGYLQQGREEEAQHDFDQCLKVDPTLKPQLESLVKQARQLLKR